MKKIILFLFIVIPVATYAQQASPAVKKKYQDSIAIVEKLMQPYKAAADTFAALRRKKYEYIRAMSPERVMTGIELPVMDSANIILKKKLSKPEPAPVRAPNRPRR